MRIGYLIGRKFICLECATESEAHSPIHDFNMGEYSQRCSRCRRRVVDGPRMTELFPVDPDPQRFGVVEEFVITNLLRIRDVIMECKNETVAGYLVRGGFICKKCLAHPEKVSPPPIVVFMENIGHYTQTCPVCKNVIARGSFDAELFEPAADSSAFCWEDMVILKDALTEALASDDSEMYESIRRTIYERVLRAVMTDKLSDKVEIFEVLGRIIG